VGGEQDSGYRIPDSGSERAGFRSQNEEHLLSADCLLLTAYCRLLTADCLRGVLDGWTPYHPIIARLSSDREQRKKTRLSCVESLMGTFTLRADFKNGSPHKSEDNANQSVTLTMCQFQQFACFDKSLVNPRVSGR